MTSLNKYPIVALASLFLFSSPALAAEADTVRTESDLLARTGVGSKLVRAQSVRDVVTTMFDPAGSNPDGTAALPGIAFTSDPDTGVFRQAANAFGIAAGGVLSVLFKTVAVAVNWLALSPAAVGGNLLIEAEGSDTDIDIEVVPKGTGAFIVGDGTAVAPGFAFAGAQTTGFFQSGNAITVVSNDGDPIAKFQGRSGGVATNSLVFTPNLTANERAQIGAVGSSATDVSLQLSGQGDGGVTAELLAGEYTFGAGTATVATLGVPVKVVATTTAKGAAQSVTIGTDNTLTSLADSPQLSRVYGRFDVDVASGTDNVTLHIFVNGASAFETAAQSITAATLKQFEIDLIRSINSQKMVKAILQLI